MSKYRNLYFEGYFFCMTLQLVILPAPLENSHVTTATQACTTHCVINEHMFYDN